LDETKLSLLASKWASPFYDQTEDGSIAPQVITSSDTRANSERQLSKAKLNMIVGKLWWATTSKQTLRQELFLAAPGLAPIHTGVFVTACSSGEIVTYIKGSVDDGPGLQCLPLLDSPQQVRFGEPAAIWVLPRLPRYGSM
jgi:hypothetical protein